MSDPGRLALRLVLEAPVELADGAGGVIRNYETVTALWAELSPISARERVLADLAGVAVTHRIRLRARDDITTRHRLRKGARLFRIATIREDAPGSRFLRIEAEEQRE